MYFYLPKKKKVSEYFLVLILFIGVTHSGKLMRTFFYFFQTYSVTNVFHLVFRERTL